MRSRKLVAATAVAMVGALVAQHGGNPASARGLRYSDLSTLQKHILSSNALIGFGAGGIDDSGLSASDVVASTPPAHYAPASDRDRGCFGNLGSNVRVAHNCLNISDADLQGRAQAQNETSAAADPNSPNHLVASWNDYRRGDGNCYGSYSDDNGKSWADTTVPTGFTRGTNFTGKARQYWQAGGDTSVAWDSRGNAYMMCQVFNRGGAVSQNPDMSSGLYLYRSTGNGGASWNFPGRPAAEQENVSASVTPLLDKPLMAVDSHAQSPFRDRVYVVWTLFAADNTSNIFEASSNDYGQTFTAPVLVSKTSTLCPVSVTVPGSCDVNQFANPFVGTDGALYVAYSNFNVAEADANDNHYQVLLSKSTDGGATFTPPALVGNYNDLPDCATYQNGQDAGRSCVPEKGSTANSYFRAVNYPSGGASPTNPAQVVVTYGSYINRHSNPANGCTPTGFSATGNPLYTGVKTAGACNNDILLAISNDGGATFTGSADPAQAASVTSTRAQATTDQWDQFAAFTPAGRLAVSYYDRQYGQDETNGYSDFSLSSSKDLVVFGAQRVTTGSSPPPTQFSGVFWGDYTGLAVSGNVVHPVWSDTRNVDLFTCPGTAVPGVPPALCTGSATNAPVANAEETYTQAVSLP